MKKKYLFHILAIFLFGGIVYVTTVNHSLHIISSESKLYEIAKTNGYEGTKKEWLKELSFSNDVGCSNCQNGTNGVDGQDGINGTNGINGVDGQDGINGTNGINGVDGQDGTNGIDGYTPIKGVDYFDGADGQDGTDGTNGTNGVDGQDGTNGIDGYTPIKGVDYFDGIDGQDGTDGVSGTVSTDTATDITGILKGDGSTISQAIAGVDYLTPGGIFSTAKFGENETNYSEFEADGTYKMNGTATTWDDLRVQILTRTGGSASPAYSGGFAGNANLYTYNFNKSATNSVYFEVQMPHSWAGTKIFPHVHFSPVGTETGNIRWILEYTWVSINGTFGAAQSYYMDSNIVENSQWKHTMANNSSGITPTASQNHVSSMLICRLYRAGGVAPDTLNSNAALVAFDIHYEMDTVGSRSETAK